MGFFARLLLFLCAFGAGLILFQGEKTDGRRRPPVEAPSFNGTTPSRPGRTMPILPPPSPEDPVVIIEGEQRKGTSVGSGFAMHSSGVWLTARHVVDGCSVVALRGRFGWSQVRVEWLHPHADLAIVRTKGAPTHFEFSNTPAMQGEDGYAVGYPQGRPGSVHGHLLGRTRMRSNLYSGNAATLAWAEVARAPNIDGSLGGISGGPVLDPDGRVLGVIVAEIPRRGRFETLAPEVLQEVMSNTKYFSVDDEQAESIAIHPEDFGDAGNQLRARLTVAQMGCSTE